MAAPSGETPSDPAQDPRFPARAGSRTWAKAPRSGTMIPLLVLPDEWEEYELLDSGNRRKLERFGSLVVQRPEPKAWWGPDLGAREWDRAQAVCDEGGAWRHGAERTWLVRFEGLTLELRLSDTSRHVGVFPEQSANWRWILRHTPPHGRNKVLTLFGYTGVATLLAATCGYAVTHVDASKPALAWARRNQERSGLLDAPIRWILDDALQFVRRERRRGNRYEGLILDPPSFGRGPKGSVWKVGSHLPELLEIGRSLLSDEARFVLLTLYNLEASSLMVRNLLEEMLGARGGVIEVGELVLRHRHSPKLLPLALFGRWEAS